MRRGIALLVVPAVGVLLLSTALFWRSGDTVPWRLGRGSKSPAEKNTSQTPVPPSKAPPSKAKLLPPGQPQSVAQATNDAYLRTTLNNYRTAVASGNSHLQKPLHQILFANRTKALQLAQDELGRSRRDADRELSQKIVDELRR